MSSQELVRVVNLPMMIVWEVPEGSGGFGPLPNGFFMAYEWGIPTTYDTWDDPPSVPKKEIMSILQAPNRSLPSKY